MTVIGIDSHKDLLAACLVDASGVVIEQRSIANTEAGHAELVGWARAAGRARSTRSGSASRAPATTADPQPRRSSTLGQRCWRCPRR